MCYFYLLDTFAIIKALNLLIQLVYLIFTQWISVISVDRNERKLFSYILHDHRVTRCMAPPNEKEQQTYIQKHQPPEHKRTYI